MMDKRRYKQVQWNKRKKEAKSCMIGCMKLVLGFIALCLLIKGGIMLYYRFDGFRMYHGEIEIEKYMRFKDKVYNGYYYAHCYREAIDTEKHNLKKILAFFQDSSTWKSLYDDWAVLHMHKTEYQSEGGEFYFEKCKSYRVNYMENTPEYFVIFRTWVYNPDDILPDYTKHLDDTLMTISFQYAKFDVYTWQHFIDIVDRETKIDTPDRVYKLKNPQTDSIECIIETKRFAEGFGFKMEIL